MKTPEIVKIKTIPRNNVNFVSDKIQNFLLKRSISPPVNETTETQSIPGDLSPNNNTTDGKIDMNFSKQRKTQGESYLKHLKKGRGSYNFVENRKGNQRQKSFRRIKNGQSPGLKKVIGGKRFLNFIKAK